MSKAPKEPVNRGPAARHLIVLDASVPEFGPLKLGELEEFKSLKAAKAALLKSGRTGFYRIIEVVWFGNVIPVEAAIKTKLE